MIRITAEFEKPEQADAVVNKLRRYAIGKYHIHHHIKRNDELPVNYPIKPEYLNGSQLSYLNGLPHILSGGPTYTQQPELVLSQAVTLSVCVPKHFKSIAKSAILQSGGVNVNVI